MWAKSVRYLDYNSGSGLSPYVRHQLIAILQDDEFIWANASSRHRLGQRVQHHLYAAATKVAKSIHASPDELVFTSSGTEANQTVIRSVLKEVEGAIIGAGEHSATYDLFPEIKNHFPFTRELPLLSTGDYDFTALAHLLQEAHTQGLHKIFLSLFWANNETGVLTSLEDLATLLKNSPVEVVLHLDGAQAWGKIEIDVASTPAQFITFSAHKIGAPAGTGVIWMRSGQRLEPLIPGSQSHGLRGGTENILGILATGYAAEEIDPVAFHKKTGDLQAHFESLLVSGRVRVRIWGALTPAHRVSNTTRFSLPDFQSYENWVELLDLHGFAVSHGSACRSQVIEPSRVLLKMGASRSEALNSIRVSFGPENTENDVLDLIDALTRIYDLKMKTSVKESAQ